MPIDETNAGNIEWGKIVQKGNLFPFGENPTTNPNETGSKLVDELKPCEIDFSRKWCFTHQLNPKTCERNNEISLLKSQLESEKQRIEDLQALNRCGELCLKEYQETIKRLCLDQLGQIEKRDARNADLEKRNKIFEEILKLWDGHYGGLILMDQTGRQFTAREEIQRALEERNK